jgi:16S rRNA (cytidine1402-2'-O)-methyltransferase
MGILYVVGTPIGNLGDISIRALEILKDVDYVACEDTRQSIKIFNHYNIKKKLISYHKYNENSKSNVIIDDLLNGKNIAIITDAGTPCISDPGYILVKKCHENGIKVLAIPGACAAISSLSVSGIDTSHFTFIGFLPTENSKLIKELHNIKESFVDTFVIYESPKRILKLFSKLIELFPNSLVYISSDLTKIYEKGYYGKIEEIYEQLKQNDKIDKGEYVIILNKNKIISEIDKEDNITIEAEILDIIIKQKCTIKDAIDFLKNTKKYKKNELYAASLDLKNTINKIK